MSEIIFHEGNNIPDLVIGMDGNLRRFTFSKKVFKAVQISADDQYYYVDVVEKSEG